MANAKADHSHSADVILCGGTSSNVKFVQACENGQLHLVRELLASESAVDVHLRSEAAFRAACSNGHLPVVQELLQLSGDHEVNVHADAGSAFSEACEWGHLDVVRELLSLTGERAVNVNAHDELAFGAACQNGHLDVVRELLALTGDRRVNVHADNEYAFGTACDQGHLNVVRELLSLTGDRQVNVHADNEYAFGVACQYGHLDIVRELLSLFGARAVNVHADDEGGFRAACENGHLDVVHELLALTGNRAVDVHVRNEGAFRAACQAGHVDIVHELLGLTGERAVDVHAGNEHALLAACIHNQTLVVRELLSIAQGPPTAAPAEPRGGASSSSIERSQGSVIPRTTCWSTFTMQRCLLKVMLRYLGVAVQLLQHAPLPAEWLANALAGLGTDKQHSAATGPAGPTPAQLAMVQQVLLAVLHGRVAVSLLTGGDDLCADAFALCSVLPGPAWGSIRQALLSGKPSAEGGQQGGARHLFKLICFAGDVAWRGVAVPLTPAPGADIARAQSGALCRPGRRAMVLRRARR